MSSWIDRLGPRDLTFAAVLLVVVLGALALAHRRGAAPRRLAGLGLFGGYLVVVALIILCPLPDDVRGGPALQVTTTLDLRGLFSSGLDDQNLQNVLLAVPFGFGLPFVLRRNGSWLVAGCLLLGAGLEGSQAVASLAIGRAYRSIDVNDLISNDLGALFGLLLFAVLSRRFSLRATTIGALSAAAVVGLALAGGPRPAFNPGGNYCETVPAGAVEVQPGYSAFMQEGMLCLAQADGWMVLRPGDEQPFVQSGPDGAFLVTGFAPTATTRAVAVVAGATEPADASLVSVDGLDGWLVYMSRLDGVTSQDPTAEVTMFAADGSQIAHASTS
jgi:glycopeptide antibiotics resistance protein